MKKFNQFTSEAKGYRDVNRQVASAQDKADRAQAKNVTSKGKKLGMLADPYSGKPTKQEVWEYKGKKWLVLGKSVEVFVPMKYHKIIKEGIKLVTESATPADIKKIKDKLNALKSKGFNVTAYTHGGGNYFMATAVGGTKISPSKGKSAASEIQKFIKSLKGKFVRRKTAKDMEHADKGWRVEYIDIYQLPSGIKISVEEENRNAPGEVITLDVFGNVNLSEDIANVAGGPLGSNPSTGSIAGYDPMLKKKPLKRSKFAGTECFEVDNDTFQKCHTGHGKYERWDKYLKDDCDTCKNIRAYAKRHPQKDIVIQREGCGTMTYLKRKGVHY